MTKTLIFIPFIVGFASSWPDFHFYPNASPSFHILKSTDSLNNTAFNPSIPTIFIVHGFESDANDFKVQGIKDRLVENNITSNVILVDWKDGAVSSPNIFLLFTFYMRAIRNVKTTLSDGISTFIRANNIAPGAVTCIGHSLGAHACGFVGKKTPGLYRISGLDPAGPFIRGSDASERLDKSDALYVDCIFTSTSYGIIDPICSVNFYPNSLRTQPNCQDNDNGCNHNSAVFFYTESISGECKFVATSCTSYNSACPLCTSTIPEVCIQMGYYAVDYKNTSEIYILRTKPFRPYCLN